MKINKIIKERRLKKNLTQEQLANFLGVTAPAVNKWEKGTSYPDITLLPALARVLDTDLNTLLSFKEELTDEEIRLFITDLSKTAAEDGFRKTYDMAMEKIKEYPTCYPLLLNVALSLDGALILYKENDGMEKYQSSIESLYQRVLCCPDDTIRNRAQSMLVSKYMQRRDYDKAEELLRTLPDKELIDKKQLQVNLLMARERFRDAAELEEEKLLTTVNEINATLMTLMEIALKENRIEDAEYIANVSQKASGLFDLWEYNSYTAHFLLHSACKNKEKCLELLAPLLHSLTHSWDMGRSPLYQHIKAKESGRGSLSQMKKTLIQAIWEDEQTAFLRESKEFQEIISGVENFGK